MHRAWPGGGSGAAQARTESRTGGRQGRCYGAGFLSLALIGSPAL